MVSDSLSDLPYDAGEAGRNLNNGFLIWLKNAVEDENVPQRAGSRCQDLDACGGDLFVVEFDTLASVLMLLFAGILLPLAVDKKVIGMFYADKAEAGSLVIPAQELNLLKTLRNQAVLAIRQKQLG